MIRRSRFEYGSSVFETSLPAMAWTPQDSSVGGSRTAASGVPASYVVRRDGLIQLTLRILEEEWPDLYNLILFGQSARSFTWFPDALDLGTSFECYLETPAPGTQWSPARDGQFPKMFTAAMTLRGVDTIPWAEYFADG